MKIIYRLTQKFPAAEKFGLVSQLRRASVSMPSNIAEGQARQGTRKLQRFLSHAEGSLAEVETQGLVRLDLGFCTKAEAAASLRETELQKMFVALRRKLTSVSSLATRHSLLSPQGWEPH